MLPSTMLMNAVANSSLSLSSLVSACSCYFYSTVQGTFAMSPLFGSTPQYCNCSVSID